MRRQAWFAPERCRRRCQAAGEPPAAKRLADNCKPAQRLALPLGIIAGCPGSAPVKLAAPHNAAAFGPPSALRSHTPPL